MLISNDFYMGKNPKLVPTLSRPGEIIDINDTNTKVKINNKIKVLNINKLKLFLRDSDSEENLTRARAKLITYKNTAQLALLMLNEQGGSDDGETIDTLCDGQCSSCDTENDYFKLNPPKHNFTQKCNSCEEFRKLFKLKEGEEQC